MTCYLFPWHIFYVVLLVIEFWVQNSHPHNCHSLRLEFSCLQQNQICKCFFFKNIIARNASYSWCAHIEEKLKGKNWNGPFCSAAAQPNILTLSSYPSLRALLWIMVPLSGNQFLQCLVFIATLFSMERREIVRVEERWSRAPSSITYSINHCRTPVYIVRCITDYHWSAWV